MITSLSNAHVRNVNQLEKKKKARYEQKAFVSEGIRMVLETPKQLLKKLYLSEAFFQNGERMEDLIRYFSDEREEKSDSSAVRGRLDTLQRTDSVSLFSVEVTLVSNEVMRKMADTQNPQGILAVTAMPEYALEEVLNAASAPLLLLPEDIQDPGNLGTMFRTAEGAGASGLILSAGCADPFQPKVVRSTMGSLFRMPFYQVKSAEEWTGSLQEIQARGIRLYAAWLPGSVEYDEPDYISGTGFLIGNEGNGLKKETAELADQRIRIPMGGKLESLNAAMSAGILMYEAARQRRKHEMRKDMP